MANYFTHFSCDLDLGSAASADAALVLFETMNEEFEDADEGVLGFAIARTTPNPAVLWLHDDGGFGEPEHVIAFVLRCAEAFNLTGQWGFCWALTCSRPRTDGFGGGAQVLDLGRGKSLDWIDCRHWLDRRLDPSQ